MFKSTINVQTYNLVSKYTIVVDTACSNWVMTCEKVAINVVLGQ